MFGWFRRARVVEHVTNSDVLKALSAFKVTTDDLEARLAAVELGHKRLRGKYYAERGGDDEPKQPSRHDLKALLARSGRFVPGQPAKHSES